MVTPGAGFHARGGGGATAPTNRGAGGVFRFRFRVWGAMRGSAARREPGVGKAGTATTMKAAKKISKGTKVTGPKRAAKRLLAGGNQASAATEAARRARHLKALSCASGAERELEELVFGDSLNVEEDELLRRLAGPRRVRHIPGWTRCSLRSLGSQPCSRSLRTFRCFQVTAVDGKGLQEESSDSGVEDEAKGNLLPKKPAWVDEDDEAEEK